MKMRLDSHNTAVALASSLDRPVLEHHLVEADSAPSGIYWALPDAALIARLKSSAAGLSSEEAGLRLRQFGPNELRDHRGVGRWRVLFNQLRSPVLWLLIFAAGASLATQEWADAVIVLVIVAASVAIGYSREYQAQSAAAKLRAKVRTTAMVVRDGQPARVPMREIVPGDVVILSAGSLVPADAVVLEATDFFVNQAILTGESFPVEKSTTPTAAAAAVAARSNCVFLGTNVSSGTARCIAVETGPRTQFGAIAHRLTLRPPETEFDRGIRHYGYLLATTMLVLVVLVLAANVLLGRPVMQTLMFSVALAVGLSPELLPAILNVNLARGAQMMARHGVLVRRLSAIENLGSMDVLCTDKTGTLTEGVVRLEGSYDDRGQPCEDVLELATVNASLQTGLTNPLDEAIVRSRHADLSRTEKVYEIPYDFVRKRLSVIVRDSSGIRLITKGAVEHVLDVCDRCGVDGRLLDPETRRAIEQQFAVWSGNGLRVLAVATRGVPEKQRYTRDDERGLTLLGFLTFLDKPKEGVAASLTELRQLGVEIKLITGDAKLVAVQVASAVGMQADRVLTGSELDELRDEALWRAAEATQLFVEVDPNQKERIILSLKKMGHVVGFLGDGVNDAPAMHAADTSLSVESAADVAKEAADFVLLDRHLDVIRRGIVEGRKTFANTLKYILITTSANLGNMISMAVASLFLPFLPLLASQVLLNNFLSDVPAVGLANDCVDPEWVSRPRRWDMRFIWRFMVEFGLLSSVFDALTFVTLLWLFSAGVKLFRTGWFVESLLTELLIALVVRTRRPFYRSQVGRVLLGTTVGCIVLTLAVPYLPGAHLFGFTPIPHSIMVGLLAISLAYVAAAELLKRWFYRASAERERREKPYTDRIIS